MYFTTPLCVSFKIKVSNNKNVSTGLTAQIYLFAPGLKKLHIIIEHKGKAALLKKDEKK